MEVVVKDTNSAKDDMAMNKLFSYLDKGIDDMQEGKLHVAEDAFQIIRNRMKNELQSIKHSDSGIKYRGYVIHKKIFQSYLLFYVINDAKQAIYVLRILKDIMNWRKILQKSNIYHFPYK